jgi:hypothetical protein
MCCLGCLGMFAPRLVLIFLWLFTNAVDRAFSSLLLPLVGIIFLPFTTLFYVLVYSTSHNGPTAAGWILVFIGFLLDLGSYSSGYRDRRRMPYYPGS